MSTKTVILHRSRRMSAPGTDPGINTYTAHVSSTPGDPYGVRVAKRQAVQADKGAYDDNDRLLNPTMKDYTVVIVFDGHINPVYYGWQEP